MRVCGHVGADAGWQYIDTQRAALDGLRDEGTQMLAQDQEADAQLRAVLDGVCVCVCVCVL